MPDLGEVLAQWAITNATVTPTSWGINNRSWFVDSSAGRHVLRVYTDAWLDQVRSEHVLLARIGTAGLPFATPQPVPARNGSTCPVIQTAGGRRVAALFERIEGDHLDDDDVAGVEAAGAAFARLDEILSRIDADREPADARLDHIHRLVTNVDVLPELGTDAAAFVRRMAGAPAGLHGSLEPRQLIHDDFAFGNVLIRGGRVVGLLDFEFAARDARAAELAIALRLVLSKGTRDRIWRPLLRGYLRCLPLTEAEIEALPTLALHHEAVVLVWWLGRYRSGNADRRSLDAHISRALALEPWLSTHWIEVVHEARALCAVRR